MFPGKPTVARHYSTIKSSLTVIRGNGFVEPTDSGLAYGGIAEVKSHLKTLEDLNGGVCFIDGAR